MAATVHVDRVLTDQAIAYFRDNKKNIANLVCPPVRSKRQSDKYQTWTANDFARSEARVRANGTPAAVVTAGRSSAQFSCTRYAAKAQIIWPERDNDDDPAAYEMSKVRIANDQVLLKREQLFASAVFTNTNVDATHRMVGDASTESGLQFIYLTGTGSNIIKPIERAKSLVRKYTNGYDPNVAVLTHDVFEALKTDSAILERIKYGGSNGDPSMVTQNILAQLWGLDAVHVLSAPYATNIEGATAAAAELATNQMWLAYQPSEAKYKPAALKQFVWDQYDVAQDGDSPTVTRYDDEANESTWVETQICPDFEVCSRVSAVHFASVIS